MEDLMEVINNQLNSSLWNLEQVKGQTDWDCELLEHALEQLYTIQDKLRETITND